MARIKLSSVVAIMVMFFIAKVTYETATAEKKSDDVIAIASDRSPASIDQSYEDHMNKK